MTNANDGDAIGRALLAFYDARARDLPWRRDADPYRVWVSEVMLQQTRVEAVIPYYERWLERFPTLAALADASLDEVLRQWEGLGYYTRARNLHRAARVVRERYRGAVPADPADLRDLPGVGDYTAGAIASIAFGRAEPAVDGNVRRVLSRLYDLADPTPAELRDLAAALVPADRPGDFNQALMELGATICAPRAPACDECPVAGCCLARAHGTALERPRPKPAKPLPHDDVGTAVVVAPSGRVLLARRPEDGLLGGLWEFPGAVADAGEAPASAAARRVAGLGIAAAATAAPVALGTVDHAFSHRRVRYHAFRFTLDGENTAAQNTAGQNNVAQNAAGQIAVGRNASTPIVWAAPGDLADFALPVAQRRIAELAGIGGR